MEVSSVEYEYHSDEPSHDDGHIWRKVHDILIKEYPPPKRVFEVGCGNGVTARRLKDAGYDIIGIDPSITGIEHGKKNNRDLQFLKARYTTIFKKSMGNSPWSSAWRLLNIAMTHGHLSKGFTNC